MKISVPGTESGAAVSFVVRNLHTSARMRTMTRLGVGGTCTQTSAVCVLHEVAPLDICDESVSTLEICANLFGAVVCTNVFVCVCESYICICVGSFCCQNPSYPYLPMVLLKCRI